MAINYPETMNGAPVTVPVPYPLQTTSYAKRSRITFSHITPAVEAEPVTFGVHVIAAVPFELKVTELETVEDTGGSFVPAVSAAVVHVTVSASSASVHPST